MLNKVMLIGNLGRDPEVRSIPSGQQVASFTLATNRRWTDKAGQRQEQTEWHQIVCWGKLAEIAAQYLTKGKQIFVEGRIQTRSWDDKQTGEKKYRTEVICENFQMLGQRGGGPETEAHAPASGGPTYDEGLGAPGAPEDDDIPF
jgi:single-strand DNA-binding protein